jgi:hypothetical protein
MRPKKQVFAQPFADIWQFSPFNLSFRVAEFLQQFMQSGQFDAERFWAFVSLARAQRTGAHSRAAYQKN